MFDLLKIAVVLMLAALGACDRPVAAPVQPSPARVSEQWRSIRLATTESCIELACLVGFSGTNRPTVVSLRLVPFSALRDGRGCKPIVLPWGMDGDGLSIQSWLSFARSDGLPAECAALGRAAGFQLWRRGDDRYPFEANNGFDYGFLPAGFADNARGRHIRCAIVFDPSGSSLNRRIPTLREAAEICVVLFYFREDG